MAGVKLQMAAQVRGLHRAANQPRVGANRNARPLWASVAGWSLFASALVAGVFAFVGGWRRRWISDDGLIVLRTVRNLLAGNGPVFNAGERVEANTSTLWQYLIWFFARLSGARLETVALWLALLLSVGAVLLAIAGTARLYPRAQHALLFAPFGVVAYFALPPARDFATSGLEWGLSIFWLAGLWFALTRWADTTAPYALAFWGGLSWLVRPELALYGGLAGLLLIATNWRSPRRLAAIAAVALPVPGGYQIFRMGYYGLLTPHTAVAKSASGAAWRDGLIYLRDLDTPYFLWFALLTAALAGAVLLQRGTAVTPVHNPVAFRRLAATLLVLLAAGIHALYVIRVGGDFMHGRMLLLPLWALLMPVSVVPVANLLRPRLGLDIPIVVATVAMLGWSGTVVARGYHWEFPDGPLTIVDERTFWTIATKHTMDEPPRFAEDFLPAPSLQDYPEAVAAALRNDDAQIMQVRTGDNPATYTWVTVPRRVEGAPGDVHLGQLPATAYLINLGMTSMNAPLNVRVLDVVGLSTPLAARQPRKEGWRIGHDKILPPEWQLADSGADIERLPDSVDKREVAAARVALSTPELRQLLESYRAPLTLGRFVANLKFSLTQGRTLQLSPDPWHYVTPEEVDAAGADTPQVAWPR